MDALVLLARYAQRSGQDRFYPASEAVPVDGVVPREWRAAVIDDNGRIERIPYELCVLRALRDAIRRREISVVGANRWRDPEDDLPTDFEDNRDIHYAALRQPLDPSAFITDLQGRLAAALSNLDAAVAGGGAGAVRIANRRGEPWITVPTLDAQPEPQTLEALKQEVMRRWGMFDLLDLLKHADVFTDSPASSHQSPPGRSPAAACCAAGCCSCSSRWARTWASSTSSTAPPKPAKAKPRYVAYAACTSRATTSEPR